MYKHRIYLSMVIMGHLGGLWISHLRGFEKWMLYGWLGFPKPKRPNLWRQHWRTQLNHVVLGGKKEKREESLYYKFIISGVGMSLFLLSQVKANFDFLHMIPPRYKRLLGIVMSFPSIGHTHGTVILETNIVYLCVLSDKVYWAQISNGPTFWELKQ